MVMFEPAPTDVVITGMGAVSSLGVGRDVLWEGLRSGRSGIRPIRRFDCSDVAVRFGGEVPPFEIDQHLVRIPHGSQDRCVQLALVAAAEALGQAGLLDGDQRATESVAVVVGSGHGSAESVERSYESYVSRGYRGIRPTTVPKCMFNGLASQLSIYFGMDGTHQVIAAACSSSNCAVGQACMLVRSGMEQIVLCGGAEAPLCRSIFYSWARLGVLARHDDPAKASRPFDADRNGLVLSEGAGLLVVESRHSAERRGAKPLATIAGYGASSDSHHITQPDSSGQVRALQRCLHSAGACPDEIDYINAHGTGTRKNDEIEVQSIQAVFGEHAMRMPVSSTKSMLGHAMGASGGLELIACVQSLNHGFVCPTINCDRPDPADGLDFVPRRGRKHDLSTALSQSFSFGGSNSAILLRRCD
jgi:3-oxoacyl-(acyl-carrier-protein) synthase